MFHDSAAALVIDGRIIAAAEEERFSRRKHGKPPVVPPAWEVPTQAATWCLQHGGIAAADLDAVGYSYESYEPALAAVGTGVLDGRDRDWGHLRTMYARRAPLFLAAGLPGLDPGIVRHVRPHVAHAASAALASPTPILAGEY